MRTVDFDNPVTPQVRSVSAEAASSRLIAREPVETRLGAIFERISFRELRRRAWHMLPGFLPFVLWGMPHNDPLSLTLQAIIVGICVVLGVVVFAMYRQIERGQDADGETNRVSCVVGYAGSVIAATLLFPSAVEIAFAVLAILAFGDGTATLFGKLLRGPALPWNRTKTWSGFAAFLFFGMFSATLAYWCETFNPESLDPPVSLATAFLVVSFAVVAAAIAESLPMRLNDNVRVGIVSLLAVVAGHSVFVGW